MTPTLVLWDIDGTLLRGNGVGKRAMEAAFREVLATFAAASFDLASVPFPVSASPAPLGVATQSFTTAGKSVLWVHGLFGEDQPDVAQLVREQCGDCAGVANFRVSVAGSFHDWLLTHLTLGFVRMKTVTIRGEKLTRKA